MPAPDMAVQVLETGEIAGSATAAAMPSLDCSWIKFKAVVGNAGNVYIGITGSVTVVDASTDTTTGWELDSGEETDWLPCDDMSDFYRICDNAGDDLTYMALG